MAKSHGFDVLALRDGRWQIEGHAESQAEAQQGAVTILNRPGVEGVRVAKDVGRAVSQLKDGDIVFERMRPSGKSDRIPVGEIDEAPACECPDDLFGAQARQTINRLFRAYLDKHALTASEVMHSHKELKRLLDHDTLVPSAVAKVASLQSRGAGGSAVNARRDAIFKLIDGIFEQARQAQALKLPRARDAGYEAMYDTIMGANGNADYRFRVAVSRDLIEIRSWFGKLAQTVDWAAPCERQEAVAPLDGFIADALNNAELLRVVLGDQPDLHHALDCLLDLSKGGLDLPEDGAGLAPDGESFTTARLNTLLGRGRLPDCHAVLMDRVRRGLENNTPLTKGGPDAERGAFCRLMGRLVQNLDIAGGPKMAEAMLQRQSRLINKGGVAGLREAATTILPELGDPTRKAGYLLALQQSRLGKECLADEIDQMLDGMLVQPSSINALFNEPLPPNRKMEKVTAIYYRIRDSDMPEQRRLQLTQRLDDLLAAYIRDDRILEKIDNPDRPLHMRALMLISMCRPEMLPRGKASDIARQIITRNLRQSNFESEVVSQIPDPKEKERVLRRIHEELYRSGFFG